MKYINLIVFILLWCVMILPYVKIGDIDTLSGFKYSLAYISLVVMGFMLVFSSGNKNRTSVFIALLLSYSNVFYTFFMMIVISVYNDGDNEHPNYIGTGLYIHLGLMLIAAISTTKMTINKFKAN